MIFLIAKQIKFKNLIVILIAVITLSSILSTFYFIDGVNIQFQKSLYNELDQPDLIYDFNLEQKNSNFFDSSYLTNFSSNRDWNIYLDYFFGINQSFSSMKKIRSFLSFRINAEPFFRDRNLSMLVNYENTIKIFEPEIDFVIVNDFEFVTLNNLFGNDSDSTNTKPIYFYKNSFPYYLNYTKELALKSSNNFTLNIESSGNIPYSDSELNYLDSNYKFFPYFISIENERPFLITSKSNIQSLFEKDSLFIKNVNFEIQFWIDYNKLSLNDFKDTNYNRYLVNLIGKQLDEFLFNKDDFIPNLSIDSVSILRNFNDFKFIKLGLIVQFSNFSNIVIPFLWIFLMFIGLYNLIITFLKIWRSEEFNDLVFFFKTSKKKLNYFYHSFAVICIILIIIGSIIPVTVISSIVPSFPAFTYSIIIILSISLTLTIILTISSYINGLVSEINFNYRESLNKKSKASYLVLTLLLIIFSFLVEISFIIFRQPVIQEFFYLNYQVLVLITILFGLIPLIIILLFLKSYNTIQILFLNSINRINKILSLNCYYYFKSLARNSIYYKKSTIIYLLLFTTIFGFYNIVNYQSRNYFYEEDYSIGADAKISFPIDSYDNLVKGVESVELLCRLICTNNMKIDFIPFTWIYSRINLNLIGKSDQFDDLFESAILLTNLSYLNNFKNFKTFSNLNLNYERIAKPTSETPALISQLLNQRVLNNYIPKEINKDSISFNLTTSTTISSPKSLKIDVLGTFIDPPNTISKLLFSNTGTEAEYSIILDFQSGFQFIENKTLQFSKKIESGFFLWLKNFNVEKTKILVDEAIKLGLKIEISPSITHELKNSNQIILIYTRKLVDLFFLLIMLIYSLILYLDINQERKDYSLINLSFKYYSENKFMIFLNYFYYKLTEFWLQTFISILIAFLISGSIFKIFLVFTTNSKYWKINISIFNPLIYTILVINLIIFVFIMFSSYFILKNVKNNKFGDLS